MNNSGDEEDDIISIDDGLARSEWEESFKDVDETLKRVKDYMEFINSQEYLFKKEVSYRLHFINAVFLAYRKGKRDQLKKIAEILVENGLAQLYKRIWDDLSEHEDEYFSDLKSKAIRVSEKIKIIWWNFSDKCVIMAKTAYKQNIVQYLMKDFTVAQLSVDKMKSNKRRLLIKATLGILHNILRHFPENKQLVREGDGLETLMTYYESTFLVIKARVMIVMAYCVNDSESDKLLIGHGVIKFIGAILKSAVESSNHVAKKYAYTAVETVEALNKIATNDNNKLIILQSEMFVFLIKMLDTDQFKAFEIRQAVNCIWTLSFHEQSNDIFKQHPDLLEKIRNINETSTDTETKKACQGILFVIGSYMEIRKEGLVKSDNEKTTELSQNLHIMLSYQWNSQATILKIRDFLIAEGYDVWVDVDKMKHSILESMADAVERSAIVVVALSEAYKESNSCRTEAEYAYKLKKPIVYLLLQEGYSPDGWLGAFLGMNLYLDVSAEEKIVPILPKLTDTMSQFVKGPRTIQATSAQTTSSSPSKSSNIQNWTSSDVTNWVQSISIGDDHDYFADFDGEMLVQLWDNFKSYEPALEKEAGFSLKQRLKFGAALKKLMKNL